MTPIYTTRKLQKLVQRLITSEVSESETLLGRWNATVFYINRKKCWLISNAKTQYNVVLKDITAADLDSIGSIFKKCLYKQLRCDGININYSQIEYEIGEVSFLPTNNDRRATGFQNQRLYELDWWKYEFGTLENMPMSDLVNRMNSSPVRLGERKMPSDFTNAIKEMKQIWSN